MEELNIYLKHKLVLFYNFLWLMINF